MSSPKKTRLGGLVEILSGFAFDSENFSEEGTLPIIRIRDVIRGRSSTFYKGEYDQKYLVRDGDMLIGMDGEFNIARWQGGPALLNQRVCRINSADGTLDDSYLFHFLPAALKSIEAATPFVTVKHLSVKSVRDIQIPLPPLAEQHRVAAVLDKADELRAKRRAALVELDALTQSIFLEMFGEKLTSPAVDTCASRDRIPVGCDWLLLTEVARLATGHTPDRERREYWDGDIPWISLTDIRTLDGKIAQETLQNITQRGIENSSAVLLPEGTVCFSRTASVGFVTVMGREMATSQDFMNWVCGPRIDPIYLMWALITSRKRLLAMSSGSTHRTIYMRIVEQFRVLLPQLSKQREFAQRITSIESLKAKHRTALAELDALFASLQHRAFRGEL